MNTTPTDPLDLFDLAEIDTRQRWQQRPPKDFPSAWASEWGFDEYGLWQSFVVKGIYYKMRYIPPGTFLMGSPENEPERGDNEIQHQVTLTDGFWLAETTVTQQLWQAVMKENPSYFKESELLPVEQVSWDDCQKFCQQLNQCVPGLSVELPTEAQWEYACRAGTQTPFSTGEQLTSEQANYRGSHPYNDGAKGEYRGKTVTVNAFTPNPWGLMQMHGNVWEWCEDVWGDYEPQAQTNPLAQFESERRVVRGGSWIDVGRRCRSACRDASRRGIADYLVGLRVTQV